MPLSLRDRWVSGSGPIDLARSSLSTSTYVAVKPVLFVSLGGWSGVGIARRSRLPRGYWRWMPEFEDDAAVKEDR
jgi:hypothetical protein